MAADTPQPLTVAATPARRTPTTKTAITGIGAAPTAMGFTSLTDGRQEGAFKAAPRRQRGNGKPTALRLNGGE